MSKWTTFAFSWHRISVFRVGKMCFLDKKELSKLIEMSFLSRNTSFPLWKKKCVNEHQALFLSMLLHFLFLPSELYLHSAYTGSPFFQSGKDVFLGKKELSIRMYCQFLFIKEHILPTLKNRYVWMNIMLCFGETAWGCCIYLSDSMWLADISVFCSSETVDICDGKQVFLSIYPMLTVDRAFKSTPYQAGWLFFI